MISNLIHTISILYLGLVLLQLQGCVPVKHHHGQSSAAVLTDAEVLHVRHEAYKLIQRLLDEELVPGLSIALVDNSGPLWLEGFGLADIQRGVVVQPDTVFRVGSLSKPVTAMMIMQLSDAGKIALDEPLEEQLPGFAIRQHQQDKVVITPRQLLSHRSGLPSDLRKGMYTQSPFTQVMQLLHDEYLAFTPDTVYGYSNLGYDLLGHLIEKQTGEPFAQYAHDQFFEPLHMHDTGYDLSPGMQQKLAAGHLDGQVRPQPPLRDTPALGLYTSAQDLSNLLVALLQGTVPGLGEDSIQQMWVPQMAEGQISLGFYPGLGWFIEDDPIMGRVVRHGGSTLLFGAELAVLPDQKIGVVVLANGADTNQIARQLTATILQLTLQTRGAGTMTQMTKSPIHEEQSPLIPSGGYATDFGLLLVDPERPRLCACIIERMLDMVRFDDGSYGLTPESAASLPGSYRALGEMRFRSRHQGGKDVLLAEREGEEIVLGSRIDSHPWDQVWHQRLGRYRTLNPDGDYSIEDLQLSSEEGVLCLHYRAPHLSDSQIQVPLKPVSATEAVVEGLGRGRGDTIRIVEIDGKQCIRFSGYMGEPIDTE